MRPRSSSSPSVPVRRGQHGAEQACVESDFDALQASRVAMLNPCLCPATGTDLAISQEQIGCLSGVSRQRVDTALKALVQAARRIAPGVDRRWSAMIKDKRSFVFG